jgi:hypothetical protein
MRTITVLSEILGCGYGDVNFIIGLEEKFGDFDWERVVPEKMSANSIIYSILDSAVSQVCDELEIDRGDIDEDIFAFCNFLDSHLWFKNGEDNCEEMHNIDEIREYLYDHYVTEECQIS